MQAEKDKVTATIEKAIADTIETGVIVELGSVPKALYTKAEYSGADCLYIILPQHKTAIPIHTKQLGSVLVQVLVDNKDLKSSQDIQDYPVVTDNQLQMWYSDYTIVEHLVQVEVYKHKTALSGWELDRLKHRADASRGHSKLLAKMAELEKDPFYAIMSEDEKRDYRRNKLGMGL